MQMMHYLISRTEKVRYKG